MSEYRRLRKWLHLDKECKDCIAVTNSLCGWCDTAEGQDILRSLNLEEYLIRILRMRLQSKLFPEVLSSSIRLAGAFCRGNATNQQLFAGHMDSILFKLLWEPIYFEDATVMINQVMFQNEALSVRFSAVLVQTVSELSMSRDHGRRHVLLQLLETLLVVGENPISVSQVRSFSPFLFLFLFIYFFRESTCLRNRRDERHMHCIHYSFC
eukprot:SAG11_NODE_32_length_22830_cov_17.507941_16_plen_209_part_00